MKLRTLKTKKKRSFYKRYSHDRLTFTTVGIGYATNIIHGVIDEKFRMKQSAVVVCGSKNFKFIPV